MVANHPPDLVPIPLGEVVGKTKTVPLDYDLLLTARRLACPSAISGRADPDPFFFCRSSISFT
jgi:hypothetical protein